MGKAKRVDPAKLRIKNLRLNRGWTMKEAADHLNLPYTTYVNYEKGERDPNTDALLAMANCYGVTVNYILGEDDEGNNDELARYLELLRTRPEMRILLDTVEGATKEEVEANVKFLETLRGKRDS